MKLKKIAALAAMLVVLSTFQVHAQFIGDVVGEAVTGAANVGEAAVETAVDVTDAATAPVTGRYYPRGYYYGPYETYPTETYIETPVYESPNL